MKVVFQNPYQRSSKFILLISLLWALVLLLLGSWWLYLIINFENILLKTDRTKIIKMLSWEGGTFIFLLILLSISLFVMYLKDQKKTKNLQAFFASLTHELKTPLASIRLQSEVIKELHDLKDDKTFNNLLERLIEDTAKLEIQMDKILQLSRIERGGELNLSSLKIVPFIRSIHNKMNLSFDLHIQATSDELTVLAEDFALELIFKNLFENTRTHTKSDFVKITVAQTTSYVEVSYQDQGHFLGDARKLGTLFYKHNSSKGSGIGLYLSSKLMEKMKGRFQVIHNQELTFNLTFNSTEGDNA